MCTHMYIGGEGGNTAGYHPSGTSATEEQACKGSAQRPAGAGNDDRDEKKKLVDEKSSRASARASVRKYFYERKKGVCQQIN
jgi:hypothetical protein